MSTTISSLFSSLQSSASSTSTSSSTSSSTSALSTSDFLSLFTTQLENQDPTDPMDTSSMTNQMAMLSIVSQTEDMNTTLTKILAAQNATNLTSAVGYIGRTVTANSDQVELSDGSATLNYTLASAASSASRLPSSQRSSIPASSTSCWPATSSRTGSRPASQPAIARERLPLNRRRQKLRVCASSWRWRDADYLQSQH